MTALPRSVDFVVVGSGPAGAACAAELPESGSVLVLEAGPDYGPHDSGAWPAELLEAFDLAETHSWGYSSGSSYPNRAVPFARARVMGGCSSHNGCAAIWGHRLDYDAWAAAGNDGWSTDEILPFLRHVSKAMRVRQPGPAEITPFHQLMLDAAKTIGIPMATDLNDLDDPIGMAPSPANIWQGIRWNAGFAFLDPLRGRPGFTIAGDALVTKIVMDGARATGVEVHHEGNRQTVQAGAIVIAGGTYNSPEILLRSGIGPADELQALGIAVRHDLPCVGRNLHDHPAIYFEHRGSDAIKANCTVWGESNWMPEEQTIAKLRSGQTDEAFDIHIYPEGGPYAENRTRWTFTIPVACMTPASRGSLRLRSADPSDGLVIDHNYLGDPEGHDLAVLVDGARIARRLTEAANADGLLGSEFSPGPDFADDDALREWILNNVHHYYHPAGTCKMGPETDPEAVVDGRGRVHGLDALYVADCSIMPQVPRANTNIPAAMVGARIGRWLAG
jgi:choline dehydrogenase